MVYEAPWAYPQPCISGSHLGSNTNLQRAHTQTEVQNIRSEQYTNESIKYKMGGGQASNHQNNSSCTLLLYVGICVSCVGMVNTRKKTWPALNEACRSLTACLRPTSVDNVYLLVGFAPPGVRRATTSRQERRMQTEDPMHSLYSHEPVNKRLKLRNSFVHSVTSLDTTPPWTTTLLSVPHKL